MKKFLFITLAIWASFSAELQAQATSAGSGIYQKLTLGVDSDQKIVTGYYHEIYAPPNLAQSECEFFLFGKKEGDSYFVQAWMPGEKKSQVTSGQLTFFAINQSVSSVLLKLEKLSRDCTQLNPKLGETKGALLDKSKDGSWTQVRIVQNSKSFYYQSPDSTSPTRSNAKRGTVLTVSARQAGWAQVHADQKPKGWIQETDLYPLTPQEVASDTASVPINSSATSRSTQESASTPPMESKSALLNRLKSLNAEAFGMALQVLENPANRVLLSETRNAREQDLNALLARLNQVDPSAYRLESGRIYETFLDLQYVKQDQQVVSLRLKEKIQALGTRR